MRGALVWEKRSLELGKEVFGREGKMLPTNISVLSRVRYVSESPLTAGVKMDQRGGLSGTRRGVCLDEGTGRKGGEEGMDRGG